MDLMDSMLDSLRQPHMLHAWLGHFPVVISLIGLVLVLMLMMGGGKSHGMRWAIFIMYLIGAVCSFFVYITAENVQQAMAVQMTPGTTLTPDAQAAHDLYMRMEWFTWIPLAAVSLASLLSVFRSSGLRVMMLVIAVIGALFAAGWTAVTTHLSDQLVYVHGVGVPASPNNLVLPLPKPPAEADTDEGDDDTDQPAPGPAPAKPAPKADAPTPSPEVEQDATPPAPANPEPVEPAPTPDAPEPPMNDLPTAEDVI